MKEGMLIYQASNIVHNDLPDTIKKKNIDCGLIKL